MMKTILKAKPMFCALLIAAGVAVAVTSCFSGDGDKSAGQSDPKAKEVDSKRHFGDSGIIFTFPINLHKPSIKIQLVGITKPDIKPLSPDNPADLAMAVRGLAAGSYDAYITAKAEGSNLEHAAFVKGIKVSRDEYANYNLTHFAPSSTLKGKVRVIGHSQHDKVSIAINGIPVTAKTGRDGSFTAPFLPTGSYDVTFARDDLRPGRLSQVAIDSNTLDLGVIAMKKAAEFNGLVTIHEVKPGAAAGQFTLDMVIADTRPDAKYIRFNHQDEGWDGIDWRPFRTSLQTPWLKNADNKVYIQIAGDSHKVLVKDVKVVQMQAPAP